MWLWVLKLGKNQGYFFILFHFILVFYFEKPGRQQQELDNVNTLLQSVSQSVRGGGVLFSEQHLSAVYSSLTLVTLCLVSE